MADNKSKVDFSELAEKPEEKKDTGSHFTINTFTESIKKVEKVVGISDLERPVWKIHMEVGAEKAVIAIENKKLVMGPVDLNAAVFGAFGIFLPYELLKKQEKGESNKWVVFISLLSQIAETVNPEDRTEWLETDVLIENIAGFEIIDDKDIWADATKKQNSLLRQENKGIVYLCLKTSDMAALVKTLKLSTDLGTLGRVMDSRDIKRKGNPSIRIGNRQKQKAWWIKESEILENQAVPSGVYSKQGVPEEGGY